MDANKVNIIIFFYLFVNALHVWDNSTVCPC